MAHIYSYSEDGKTFYLILQCIRILAKFPIGNQHQYQQQLALDQHFVTIYQIVGIVEYALLIEHAHVQAVIMVTIAPSRRM
jgi:hypothetical protein